MNIGNKLLSLENFEEQIVYLATKHKIPLSQVKLELTEREVFESASAFEKIKRLKDIGFHIAIDDFGTGFSSLSYLSKIDVDCIKIDKSFIDLMFESEKNLAILKNMLQLCAELNVTSIAEGVERADQHHVLSLRL